MPQFPIPGTPESVTVTGATDADVLQAIANNTAFPERANGQLPLGSIALDTTSGNTLTIPAGPSASVSFSFSSSLKTGAGVFDKPTDAMASLGLQATPKVDLTLPGDNTSRYLTFMVGYQASGSVSGTQPIGALGSVTFGAQASGDGVFAVLHRFPGATGADTVLADTFSSWHLPRLVTQLGDLKPGTWIVFQADGSIGIQLGAQLGYDFNFVRQFNLLGVARSLGAKIDADLKASFGFSASGQYLVVLGRETDGPVFRLRLFKQSDKEFDFGLNLNVGITGQANLPSFNELIQAVCGVHGLQVLNDLQLIQQWTDPTKDLGDTVARLLNKTGLDLLTRATCIDAGTEFDKARQIVLNALQQWDALPDRASAALWKILGNAAPAETADFKTFLTALANPDPQARAQALAQALSQTVFGDSAKGQWLEAIADQGLLALSNNLGQVQGLASKTLNILNGGVIKNIQDFINQRLDLGQIQTAIQQNNFAAVDEWLIKRLSDFLDQEIADIPALKQIQTAIHTILTKAPDYYAKAIQALNNKYSLNFAATYQRNTSDTALLDVNFDMTVPAAADLLHQVLANAQLDKLLVSDVAGVTLNQASLSHEIKCNTDVQFNLPFFDSNVQHITDSVVNLTAEHDSGRVLLSYQLDASNTVRSQSRYQSQLSIMGKLEVVNGVLQPAALTDNSIAYQSLQVKSDVKRGELEARTTPFINSMLANVLPDGPAQHTFFAALDQTISAATGNGNNDFGDVAWNFQVSLPGSVLAAWFQPMDDSLATHLSMMMSRSLQAKLRALVPFYFFQDLNNLNPNSAAAAALLVWSAMPVSTSVNFDNGNLTFNTDKAVFWNWPDVNLRQAFAVDRHTGSALVPMLRAARARWLDAGNNNIADSFTDDQAPRFLQAAIKLGNGSGDEFLSSLLFTESQMVTGAAVALRDVRAALPQLATAPTKAIKLLSKFGADLSTTFDNRLSVYSTAEAVRTLNSMLLTEASNALSGQVATPTAMMNLIVLTANHTFKLTDYLGGSLPPKDQVAVAQTLTNLGA